MGEDAVPGIQRLGKMLRVESGVAPADQQIPSLHADISALIEEFGPAWLGVDSPVEHDYVRYEPRHRSALAVVDVRADSEQRRVLVKVAAPVEDRPGDGRPRIVATTAIAERLFGEAAALGRLHESLSDDQFFAIEPLATVIDPAMLAMEWCPHPNLGRWLGTGPTEDEISSVLGRAGAWLRRFHELAQDEEVAYGDAESVSSLIRQFTSIDHAPRLEKTFRSLGALALERARHLPNEMELGLLHGDMAPRNLLIDDALRVGGIDVAARWRAPVMHDIAAFLIAVRISRWRLDPRIHATNVESWQSAFLAGYGLDDADRRMLGVFSALLLIDRASAATGSVRRRVERILLLREAARITANWHDD